MLHVRKIVGAKTILSAGGLFASLLLASIPAHAVPSFMRQTGAECTACHVSFPELTPFGRQFKLLGYTLGTRQAFPLSAMIEASMTKTSNTKTAGVDRNSQFFENGATTLQVASLFYAGKITEHTGAFVQATSSDNGQHRHGAMDNTDIRYADRTTVNGKDLIYGVTLNNNPTAQDVWNSTPAWWFPYVSPAVGVGLGPSTVIEGTMAQKVVGLSVYGFWNNLVYAELGAYKTPSNMFSALTSGSDRMSVGSKVNGTAPYWRLALEHNWDSHSASVGTFGLTADLYPLAGNPTGATDRYKDTGFDAQYQYITDAHRFSAQATAIREKQEWNASYPTAVGSLAPANASDVLKSSRLKFMYYYQRRYGASIASFTKKGDTDTGLYSPAPVSGSNNGSPETKGFIYELNYLPLRNIKLSLQYTAYQKYLGASSNYDGSGRNASDNNTTYLNAWFMF